MFKALIAWMGIVGVASYFIFNGLVQGMPGLDVAAKHIASLMGA